MAPNQFMKLVAFSLLPGLGLAFWFPARSLVIQSPKHQLLDFTSKRSGIFQLYSEPEGVESGSEDENSSLGNDDWRAFRAKLVSGGLKSTEDEAEAVLDAPAPREVARKNTALLREQNPELVGMNRSAGY